MPSPTEVAHRTIQAQIRIIQKFVGFLRTTLRKLIRYMRTLINGLTDLIGFLNDLRQYLPATLLTAARMELRNLLLWVYRLPNTVATLSRLVNDLASAVREDIEQSMNRAIMRSISLTTRTLDQVVAIVRALKEAMKPLDRLFSTLRSAERMIRLVVENIANILRDLTSISNIKSIVTSILRKIVKAQRAIGETEKNMQKLIRAQA